MNDTRRKYGYLTLEDRQIIETMYGNGAPVGEIAEKLKCPDTTVYRELRRGDTGELDKYQRNGYSATLGQRALQQAFKRRGKIAHEQNQARKERSHEEPCCMRGGRADKHR